MLGRVALIVSIVSSKKVHNGTKTGLFYNGLAGVNTDYSILEVKTMSVVFILTACKSFPQFVKTQALFNVT